MWPTPMARPPPSLSAAPQSPCPLLDNPPRNSPGSTSAVVGAASAHAVVLAEAWPPDHLMQTHAVQLHVSLTATCSTHNQPATTLLHLPCVPRHGWQPKLSHPATKSPRQHGQALPIQDKSLPTQVPPSQRNTTAHRLNWLRTRSHRSGPLRRSR